MVDDVRVRATGRSVELPKAGKLDDIPRAHSTSPWRPCTTMPVPVSSTYGKVRLCWFTPCAGPLHVPVAEVSAFFECGGRKQTPAYLLSDLVPGHVIEGPALLIDEISTIVVGAGT